MALIWLLAVLMAVLYHSVHAQGEDARVLPQGRSRLSFVYGKSGSITQGFNANGGRETLLGRYGAESLNLSADNLRKFSPDLEELISLLNKAGHFNILDRDNPYHGFTRSPDAPLLGDALTLGNIFAEAQGERSIQAISYQYGVSSRLSVGVIVPFVKNKVSVRYGFTGERNADEIYRIIRSQDVDFQDHQRAVELLGSLNSEDLQTLLEERGYQRFDNYEGGGLGDVAIGGRFNYLDRKTGTATFIHSVQSFLTLPTGSTRPTNALTQLGTGNGTVDLTSSHIANFTPFRFLTLSNGLYYTHRFANHTPVRVRQNPNDILPDSANEELLAQKLADKAWTTLGARFLVTEALTFDMSYEWFWRGRDHYEGSRLDRDYTYLSEMSDSSPSYTETLQLGASVSSIPGFLRSELPVPLDFSLNFYLPYRGKNAMITPYGTAELALYF